MILIGDVNCNDLNFEEKNKILRNLRELYHEHQLKQLIKTPTRTTLTSQTIIDNLATNKPRVITSSRIFTIGFSDHDLVFGICKVMSQTNWKQKLIKSRQLKNYDPFKFTKDLQQVDWEAIIQIKNIHTMSQEWEKQFISIPDKHASSK